MSQQKLRCSCEDISPDLRVSSIISMIVHELCYRALGYKLVDEEETRRFRESNIDQH